jgi:hypothetical protein
MSDPVIDTTAESTEVALIPPDTCSAPVGRHPIALVATLPPVSPEHVFDGLSLHALTDAQRGTLLAVVDPTTLDVLPTGEVYLPQVHYRRIFNAAFGPGAWGMMPLGDPLKQDNTIIQKFALFVGGKCVAVAMGEQAYYPNGRMTWATAWEASKSNALMRCAKDLGVASECWDKRFIRGFLDAHCLQVWVPKKGSTDVEALWRRLDTPAFRGEKGRVGGDNATGARGSAPRTSRPPPPSSEAERDEDPANEDLASQLRESIAREETKKAGAKADLPAREPGADDPPLRLITNDQRVKLLATARRVGIDVQKDRSDPLHQALAKKGIVSVKDIPAEIFEAVLAWVEQHGKRR